MPTPKWSLPRLPWIDRRYERSTRWTPRPWPSGMRPALSLRRPRKSGPRSYFPCAPNNDRPVPDQASLFDLERKAKNQQDRLNKD
jgi:hypothetical protein